MVPVRPVSHAALAVLVAVAGCLGAGGPATSGGSGATTAAPGATTAGTPAVDCPEDTTRHRRIALDHVADERDGARDRLTIVAASVVDYPLLGECYYHAKVRAPEATVGVFVAANGTVANRSRVEARARRAARERYGKRTPALARAVEAADPGERIGVVVRLREIDRDSLDIEATPGTTAYKREVERERAAAAERRTAATAARLRGTEGVTVASVSSLRVVVRATPAGVERLEGYRNVSRLSLRRTDTPTALPTG